MIADGFGPTSENFGRTFLQNIKDLPYNYTTPLRIITNEVKYMNVKIYIYKPIYKVDYMKIIMYIYIYTSICFYLLLIRSSNSLITDSAAWATAFSCGVKTNNSCVAVYQNGSSCGTMLESAKHLGYVTGLVVTSRITDATPAAFSAHVKNRNDESEIAVQQIGGQVDLMFGGGRKCFIPNNANGSCRDDSRDIIQEAKEKGFKYFSTRKEFDGLTSGKNE